MKNIENRLMNFIDKTPNAFICVENLKEELLCSGFSELYETEAWDNLRKGGKYFTTKNDSTLIAFKIPEEEKSIGFNILSAHTDSPSFSIKPNADIFENGYLKLNISRYGGMLNYSWLDRPLSLAGRVIIKKAGVLEKHTVNIDKDLLLIPSQAIHINPEVNSKNSLNPQTDLLPVLSLSEGKRLDSIIMEALKQKGVDADSLCDYDLYLYNRDKSKFIGEREELILAPRLDDLASLYPAFLSFMAAENTSRVNVFCAFDKEEIGSLSSNGADSTTLLSTLLRISDACGYELSPLLGNSFAISADNAHALHPNTPSKSDPTNKVALNKGVVVKHHINYTTDALSSSIFKELCEAASVPYQDFACKSDMGCGSTLGGISQSQVSVDSVDIGLPQLAMHSANETIGREDVLHLYKAISKFYESKIERIKNKIKIEYK